MLQVEECYWKLLQKNGEFNVSDLTVNQKVIIKEINGERIITYGEIASKAVGIEIPEEIELKEITDFKLIGTSVKNVDGKKIVTGKPLIRFRF